MNRRFTPESLLGTTLPSGTGAYRLLQVLNSGGLAHVFLAAREENEGEHVAVKLLRPELEEKPEVSARFDREALAACSVRHENVVRVFEPAQRDRGLTYFSCEHLVGVDLADQMGSERKLAPERAVRIALGAARGLAEAHAVGIVHRDVKPENIFLVHAPDGREVPRVLDFGSAWLDRDPALPNTLRITMTTGFVGTPGYVAPEQAEGAPARPTADVYSLGVVLYEALSGRPPFTAKSWMDLLYLHAQKPVPPLSGVSPQLAALVLGTLAKAAADRVPSMAALYSALSAVPEAKVG